MLTKRIIPCFDVDNGRVVKGVSFVDLRDAGDPVELAAAYDAGGADELVFLDITASSDNRTSVYDMIARHLADCATGELRAVIDRSFPLSEAAAAHEYIESRQAVGRVVLIP